MTPSWRVFYALLPGPAARERLSGLAATLAEGRKARLVPPSNLHLTLLFVGEVAPGRLDALARAGRQAAATVGPQTLTLAHIGWFGQAGVVWAGPQRPPAALVILHDALAGACRTAGIGFDDRPLVPHVTLLRKARLAPDPALVDIRPPIAMPVRRLALMRSLGGPDGVRYRPIVAWPLAGPARRA